MKVFLSHSSADKDLARRLAIDLRNANVDVWLDQWEIGVGEEFSQKIEQGLEQVQFAIVLLTRASVASEWVNREWRNKMEDEAQTRRIAVVPVRGELCEIPDFLAQRSYADISGGIYPQGFKHLLTILRHYSNDTSITLPESKQRVSQDMLPIVTPLGLEVGSDLIPLFEPDSAGYSRALEELAPSLGDALQAEFGFPFPGIRIRGNESGIPTRGAMILVDEIPEIMIEVFPEYVLVDTDVEQLAAMGIHGQSHDDVVGRVRARIASVDRAAAEAAGVSTWDATEYLFLLLHTVIRRRATLFLDIDVTRRLVDAIEATSPDLVAATVPKVVSWFELTDILRRLVDEEIGINDLEGILEALSRSELETSDTVMMTEQVRHALNRQITGKIAAGRNPLEVIQMDPEIDVIISDAIQRTSSGSYLALEPQITQNILFAIRSEISALGARAVALPLLVTAVEIRRYVRNLVSLEFPSLHVLSRQDLDPAVPIKVVAYIHLARNSATLS